MTTLTCDFNLCNICGRDFNVDKSEFMTGF